MPCLRAARPFLLFVALALVAALLLSGCTRNESAKVTNRTLPLDLTEYRMRPLTNYARPGGITIRARNRGQLAHNVALVKEGQVLARTTTMQPGDTASMTLSLEPGTYRLFSSLSNDDTLGLNGFLIVR